MRTFVVGTDSGRAVGNTITLSSKDKRSAPRTDEIVSQRHRRKGLRKGDLADIVFMFGRSEAFVSKRLWTHSQLATTLWAWARATK